MVLLLDLKRITYPHWDKKSPMGLQSKITETVVDLPDC
ncbi:hypothetical protein LDG_5805 [Legionella drancourtii LLAP12]|uniref:Uncharacterized protein n=1 Tax=Legionella drancourtii LLAP12 TaxID=658187 RepID=G9EKR6_9GAMM|nr:hypothetical protein LDG_5805 [Legionella drancourtii LLAP12]